MASGEQDKLSPDYAMHVKTGRGSGLPRMLTGELPLHAKPETVQEQMAVQTQLPMRHFKSQAAREASMLNLAKAANLAKNRGSRGSDKGVPMRLPHGLTLRQEQFCQNVMAGMSHAQAYRDAYNCHNMKPAVVYHRAYHVATNSRVVKRMDDLWRIREGRLSHTPSQLRLFVTERLHIEALNPNNPPSVRVRAVELIGKIGRVALFQPEQDKPEENQSVDALLKRITPLLEAGKALALQASKAETPNKSR